LLNALSDAGGVTRSIATDSTYVKAACGVRRKRGRLRGNRPFARWLDDQGPCVHRRHRRPYALKLTPGNVSDVEAAPAFLKRAWRMRYLLACEGCDAD